MAVRIRRDIWTLAPDDPVVTHYSHAVKEMKERPPHQVTSWTYQAAIHGTLAEPEETLWNQCQHGTWFFLPWHRMFVLRFEEIIRQIVHKNKGPEDWALPFWNYGRGGEYAELPLAFRNPKLSDGQPNPLYIEKRKPGINGNAKLPDKATSAARALARPSFPGAAEFGGGVTNPTHFPIAFGKLENTPHNIIHTEVGGKNGLMSFPETAALDPIFWLHHSNIDRLWTVWNADPSHKDPTDPRWRRQSFELFDKNGTKVAMKCEDVVETEPLGYVYEPSAPLAAVAAPQPPLPPSTDGLPVNTERPELVGATAEAFDLVGEPVEVKVPIDAEAAGELQPGQHVYLNVEEIQGERNPGVNYAIYVELPAGSRSGKEDAHHIGNLSFFGIEGASRPRGDAHPHGLRTAIDITATAQRLAGEGDWAGHDLGVAFRPLELVAPDDPGAAKQLESPAHHETPVRVGRVSVFYDA